MGKEDFAKKQQWCRIAEEARKTAEACNVQDGWPSISLRQGRHDAYAHLQGRSVSVSSSNDSICFVDETISRSTPWRCWCHRRRTMKLFCAARRYVSVAESMFRQRVPSSCSWRAEVEQVSISSAPPTGQVLPLTSAPSRPLNSVWVDAFRHQAGELAISGLSQEQSGFCTDALASRSPLAPSEQERPHLQRSCRDRVGMSWEGTTHQEHPASPSLA